MTTLDGVRIPQIPVELASEGISAELAAKVGTAAGLAAILGLNLPSRISREAQPDYLVGQLLVGLAAQDIPNARALRHPEDETAPRMIDAPELDGNVICPKFVNTEGYTVLMSVLLGHPKDVKDRLSITESK